MRANLSAGAAVAGRHRRVPVVVRPVPVVVGPRIGRPGFGSIKIKHKGRLGRRW